MTAIPSKTCHTIIFDFDSTLFNTELVKETFYEMGKCHGYSDEEARDIYISARAQGEKMTMSLSHFIGTLRQRVHQDGKEFNSNKIDELIIHMQKGGLLPGAEDFLDYVKKRNLKRKLLSLGVASWQEEKVSHAGIDRWIEEKDIEYTTTMGVGKTDVMKRLYGNECTGEHMVVVNDKADETRELLRAFPQIHALVRRERRDRKYTEEDFIALRDEYPGRVHWSEDLKELLTIFKQEYVIS